MKKLERSLGLGPVLIVGLSSMLGTGIFVAPGIVYAATGPSMILAFVLAAYLILPAAMSMSELATAMPTSGGIYVYTDRAFGPLLGTIVGFGLWLSLLFKTAFALKGFGEYLSVFTSFPNELTALITLVLVVILNIAGVSKVASSLAYIMAACLLTLLIIGVVAAPQMSTSHLENYFSQGVDGFMIALSLSIGAYAGLTKLTAIAEEVKHPERNLPRGILFSLGGVALIYGLISLLIMLVLLPEQLIKNITPLYTLTNSIIGVHAANFLAIMAILTLLSMANAGLLASSRFPFAMSRDKLLPSLLGKIHAQFLTPLWSIILSGVVIAFIIMTMDVEKVAKLASVFIIQMFILVNITVITLRESAVQWYRPKYKSPFYPFQHIIGIVTGLILLFYMSQLTLLSIIMVVIPAGLIFLRYGRNVERVGVVGIKGKRLDLVKKSEDEKSKDGVPSWIRPLETLDIEQSAKVVVPLFGRERSPETLTEMAFVLSQGEGTEVIHITEVPEQTDLNDMDEQPGLKALRRRIRSMAEDKKGIIFDTVATHDMAKTIFDIGERAHCDWLLVEWSSRKAGRMTFYNPIGWIQDHMNCHIAYFNDKGIRNFKKILAVIKGNASDDLVIETCRILAAHHHAMVTVAFERKEENEINPAQEKALLDNLAASQIHHNLRFNTADIKFDNKAESITQMTIDYDLIIYGQNKYSFIDKLFKPRDNIINTRAACSVLRVSKSIKDTKIDLK